MDWNKYLLSDEEISNHWLKWADENRLYPTAHIMLKAVAQAQLTSIQQAIEGMVKEDEKEAVMEILRNDETWWLIERKPFSNEPDGNKFFTGWNVCVCEERKLISSTELLKKEVDYSHIDASKMMQVNNLCEVKFRDWVLKMIDKTQAMRKEDLIYGGAEYCGCSIVTTEKYLKKLTSITGPLEAHQSESGIIITRRSAHE